MNIVEITRIYDKFNKQIKDIRLLYMSLILQEEQALYMIQQSEIINSVYLKNDKFVFGERFIDDSTFFTEIDVDDCSKQLYDIEGTLNDIRCMLIIRLTAIYESFFRQIITIYKTEHNNLKEKRFLAGNPEKRLLEFERLFDLTLNFDTEYKALNFLFRLRNCIAHNNSIIDDEYFKDNSSGIGNISDYRKNSNKYGTIIEINKKAFISEYDFNELIYLVELVVGNIYRGLIINFNQ